MQTSVLFSLHASLPAVSKGTTRCQVQSYLMTFRCRGEFYTETVRSPLPTVAPSTNPVSSASNSDEGEADTPNSQFSMVTTDVDN